MQNHTTRRIRVRAGGVVVWDDTVIATLVTVVAALAASIQLLVGRD